MIRIYLAEDQEMLKSALQTILNFEEDFEVIATALEGNKAVHEIELLQPDVVILDIEMPNKTGLEIAKIIRTANWPIKIVILTTFAHEAYFHEAVTNQVNAYLLKDSPSEYLIQAIREVLNGTTIYSPELVTTVLRAEKNPLTAREMEVLETVKTGASTAEMAENLFLSEGTIRNYISAILSKTGTKTRIEAINIAKKNGWIS